MFKFSRVALVAALAFTLTACSSSEPDDDPDPTPTPPSFSIASVPTTCDNGAACLLFAATPSESVALTEVVIRNPLGQSERFNANGDVVLRNETIDLQNPGLAYTRVSGTWTFTFIGTLSPTVPNGNFNVVTTVPVGAFAPEQPAN